MKKTELVKSLQEIGFSQEDINEVLEKSGMKDLPDDYDSEETEEEKKEREEKERIEKEKMEGKEEKSMSPDILKAIGEIFQKNQNSDLQKSIDGLSERYGNLEKSISELSSQVQELKTTPKPFKSFKSSDILKKGGLGEENDEDGKKVLSVTMQKEEVSKSLEDVIEKSTDSKVKMRYESTLLNYNSGNVPIPQDIAVDLFKNHDIRLIQ